MKLLSIVVPSYNSQDYLKNCIESLLPGGEAVEIIIVNDGSTDGTADIANEYAEKYPTIVRAIHQPNGGHGEAVNTGIKHANGIYFKVVDSDDWVDSSAYKKILETLTVFSDQDKQIDMLISNYVYENDSKKHKRTIKYTQVLPKEKIFSWEDIGHFKKGQYILMHSVIYRTKLLHECGLKLPKHTFYVDNLFVYLPMPYVRKMYYLNVDFYRYFIGRDDQSVNEKNMIRRIDQQIYVNKCLVDAYISYKSDNRKLNHYLFNYLEIITVITSVMLICSGTEENLKKKKELWNYIYSKDRRLYRRLRSGIMGQAMNLPGRSGRMISVATYKVSQKVVGFN